MRAFVAAMNVTFFAAMILSLVGLVTALIGWRRHERCEIQRVELVRQRSQ